MSIVAEYLPIGGIVYQGPVDEEGVPIPGAPGQGGGIGIGGASSVLDEVVTSRTVNGVTYVVYRRLDGSYYTLNTNTGGVTEGASIPLPAGGAAAPQTDQPRGAPVRRNGVDYQQMQRPDGSIYYINLNTMEQVANLPPQSASPAQVAALAGTTPTGVLGGLPVGGPAPVTGAFGAVPTGIGQQTPVFSLEEIAAAGATPGTQPADIMGTWPAYMTAQPGSAPGPLPILAGGLVGAEGPGGQTVGVGMAPIPGTLTTPSPQLTGQLGAGYSPTAILLAAGYVPSGDPQRDAQQALYIITQREVQANRMGIEPQAVTSIQLGGRDIGTLNDLVYWDPVRQQWVDTLGRARPIGHVPEPGEPTVRRTSTTRELLGAPSAIEEAGFPTPAEQFEEPPPGRGPRNMDQGGAFTVGQPPNQELVTIRPLRTQGSAYGGMNARRSRALTALEAIGAALEARGWAA